MALTPNGAFSIILVVWSWLNPLGCHTETLPTSWSIRLSNGGVGEDGRMTGGGNTVGESGGGEGRGREDAGSEEVAGWRVRRGDGDTKVGERGGGRDAGGWLVERGLETGERGGGRDGGAD